MTLEDRVKERYSNQKLKELTNPDDEGATTVDDTLLSFAARDVEADFKMFSGFTYDETVDRHVAVATQGVFARLTSWTGEVSENADKQEARFRERARSLKERLTPKSSSKLKITKEVSGSRPWSDRANFWTTKPNPPRRRGTDTDSLLE